MVEYGFKLERAIADRAIPIIVGYANGGIGYIATAKSHEEGGYEPNNCPLTSDGEAVIIKQLGVLADRVIGDVFESFSKTSEGFEESRGGTKRTTGHDQGQKIAGGIAYGIEMGSRWNLEKASCGT